MLFLVCCKNRASSFVERFEQLGRIASDDTISLAKAFSYYCASAHNGEITKLYTGENDCPHSQPTVFAYFNWRRLHMSIVVDRIMVGRNNPYIRSDIRIITDTNSVKSIDVNTGRIAGIYALTTTNIFRITNRTGMMQRPVDPGIMSQ